MMLRFAAGYMVAAAVAARGASLRSDPRVMDRLREASSRRDPAPTSVLAWIGRRTVPPSVRSRAARRSSVSGSDLDRLLGTKVALAAAGIAVGLLAATSAISGVALAAVLGAGGFTLPSFRAARRRAFVSSALRRQVADALDIVTVAVSAGLTPRLALERASAAVAQPLASELDAARRDIALGVPWLSALSGAASRTGLEELRRLVATLARSERLGSPVAERLRALARDVRSERRAEAEERARRAPVAMLFPLVFLILPAFVLTAVVPAVLVATRGIR